MRSTGYCSSSAPLKRRRSLPCCCPSLANHGALPHSGYYEMEVYVSRSMRREECATPDSSVGCRRRIDVGMRPSRRPSWGMAGSSHCTGLGVRSENHSSMPPRAGGGRGCGGGAHPAKKGGMPATSRRAADARSEPPPLCCSERARLCAVARIAPMYPLACDQQPSQSPPHRWRGVPDSAAVRIRR